MNEMKRSHNVNNNQYNTLNLRVIFLPRDNVIYRRVASPVPVFRAGGVVSMLSQSNIKFVLRDVTTLRTD